MDTCSEKCLKLPTLGRPFRLGLLYDCHHENLIPDVTLWSQDYLEKNTLQQSRHSEAYEILVSKSQKANSSALDVRGSLRLSYYVGLVDVSGSANFLNDRKVSANQNRVTLKYTCTNKYLSLNPKRLKDSMSSEVLASACATHVVTGLLYGANAFFVFDENQSGKGQGTDEGSLQALVKTIPHVISKRDSAQLQRQSELIKEMQITFHGDVKRQKNLTTYWDVIKLYQELPCLTEENSEAVVPIVAWLYPLHELDSRVSSLVHEINFDLMNIVENVVEELHELNIRCCSLMNGTICKNCPFLLSEMEGFRDNVSAYKNQLLKLIQHLLPKIRKGDIEDSQFANMLTMKEDSPFQSSALFAWIQEKEMDIALFEKYTKSLHGISIVSKQEDLEVICESPSNKYVVCFNVHRSTKENYIADMKNFLETTFLPKSTNKQGNQVAPLSFEVKSFKKKGYQDSLPTNETKIPKNTESSNPAFSKNAEAYFALYNACHPDRCKFVIMQRHADIKNHDGFIYFYKDGTLADPNFEPPSNPRHLAVSEISYDNVTLTWQVPAYGSKNVIGYEVIYKSLKDEKWLFLTANSLQLIVTNLQPSTKYEFKVRAWSEPGPTIFSPLNQTVLTFPSSPPGKPVVTKITCSVVKLDWEKPSKIATGLSVADYKITASKNSSQFEVIQTVDGMSTSSKISITHFETYKFRIIAVCSNSDESPASPESDDYTSKPTEMEILKDKTIANLEPIKTDPIPVYQVKTTLEFSDKSRNIRKCIVGNPTYKGNIEKVLMLVGATGSGKTTLINGMINYIFGIEWDEQYRLKLIADSTDSKHFSDQAVSQTSWITSYTIHHQKGMRTDFTLTIIDTPGFGDTTGITQDKKIAEQIKHFFSYSEVGGVDHIDHIDAIGFVAQSSLARLTHTQKYIFDSILSLFGKNIEENIFMFLTFADGQNPQVLAGLEKAGMETKKYFKLNNSALYVTNKGKSAKFDELFWQMGNESLGDFLIDLTKVESQSLTLTKQVLDERSQVEAFIQGIQYDIRKGLNTLDTLKREINMVNKFQSDIDANKNFTYIVLEETVKTEKIPEGKYITNCTICNRTCHYPCILPDDNQKAGCGAIFREGDKIGYCRICSDKHHWTDHKNMQFRYVIEKKEVTKTVDELKERYHIAKDEKEASTKLVERLATDFQANQIRVINFANSVRLSLKRLNQIALKPNPLSTTDYIDLLINTEKSEAEDGWQERVVQLMEVRKEAEYIQKLTKENYDPLEEYRRRIKDEGVLATLNATLERLERATPKPNPVLTEIDMLIQSEERGKKPDWQKRVSHLNELRQEIVAIDETKGGEEKDKLQMYKEILKRAQRVKVYGRLDKLENLVNKYIKQPFRNALSWF